jgi:putative DNA primase/helicase
MDKEANERSNGRTEETEKIIKEAKELINTEIEEPIKHPPIDFFLNEDEKSKKKTVSITRVVEYILSIQPIKTIYESKNEVMYSYKKGIWQQNGRGIVQILIEKLLNSYSTNNIVNEITNKIKRLTIIDNKDFNNNPRGLICLGNGVFNFKTRQLEPFNQDYYFKRRINIDYNEKAKFPNIMKFLEETFYPEDLPIIQEWIGFQLFNDYFIKKAMILFGEKDTGKTIFLKLLTNFIGSENVSGISLQRISGNDKFALSSLKDKYSNIYDDLSSQDLKDGGGFKIATGGGYITAEYKFGDSFQFLNYAKHTFACNKIPSVQDIDDDAYYSRWIPIPLDNQVMDKDRFLINKLTTKEELSGLLNWAIEGLYGLIEKGQFSFNRDSQQIKRIMTRHGNSLVSFIQDCCLRSDGNKIIKDNLYQIYHLYCKLNELPLMSKNQVGRSFEKLTGYALAKTGSERSWDNVKIDKAYFFKRNDLVIINLINELC